MKSKPKMTVFDRAKQYAASEADSRAYELKEGFNILMDDLKYNLAVAWDDGYAAGRRAAGLAKKAKRKTK